MQTAKNQEGNIQSGIAIIGMDCKFPGASTIDEFWENLKNGVESISFFADEEIKYSGLNPDLVDNPRFVRVKGESVKDFRLFDASFFGYSAKEAELLNPQTRVFMECVWNTLESAGYDPDSYPGLIGLYAGSMGGLYWNTLTLLSGKSHQWGEFAANHLTNEDYLCSQVAYKLNFKGPCFYVQTACSTSLVALHLACQALLNGETDIALAGGVTITGNESTGYIYKEGMIFSPDGHCRAFDEKAAGTISGEGAAVVALKLLEDAIDDRDVIYAVIRGTAINNDGNRKVGFTAPSIEGQRSVIKEAMGMAEVDPESIGYVETHGTGTPLGDPIEIAALKLAYNSPKKGYCAIGSVKTNFGHLDNAAGMAGLIKTILTLKHKQIPPSLHYNIHNSKIDLDNSPFYVNTGLKEWKNPDGYPLRAGVSSFGIGGTNSHIILEEYTERDIEPTISREQQLILISAHTESSLHRMTEQLKNFLIRNPDIYLPDVAYTLKIGKKAFQYRKMLTCSTVEEGIELLASEDFNSLKASHVSTDKKNVIFMFPGLGSQYVNMGKGIYDTEPEFREPMDRCFEILTSLGYNLKRIIYPSPDEISAAMIKIEQFEFAQLVVFVFEYALAKLLFSWGIKPYALIGYSFGEYVAACFSGVFSIEDALMLVVTRGRLIQKMPEGMMLSIPLPAHEVQPLLEDGIYMAIDNGPSCIVAGNPQLINAFEKKMKEKRCICMQVKNTRAIHSKMMAPLTKELETAVTQFSRNKPIIPYISNLSGYWIKMEDATDPGYWSKHLQETVLFADGVKTLLEKKDLVFIEVGPGRDLSALVRHHTGNQPEPHIVNIVKHPQEKITDNYHLLNRLGHLWISGININWLAFYSQEERRRIPLPTYSFEKNEYWIPGDLTHFFKENYLRVALDKRKTDIADWFHIPSWERCPLEFSQDEDEKEGDESCWLVFCDSIGFSTRVMEKLKQERPGATLVTISIGTDFKNEKDAYTINPDHEPHYDTLVRNFIQTGRIPSRILHFWGVSDPTEEKSIFQRVERAQNLGLHCLLSFVRAMGKNNLATRLQLDVVVNNLCQVVDAETIYPEKATVIGAVKIIPVEYFNITSRLIDIVIPKTDTPQEEILITQLLEEFNSKSHDKVIAYRGNYRWNQIVKPYRINKSSGRPSRLRERGVYIVLGGFGGMGFSLAGHLAESLNARLALVGRSFFPQPEEWEQWLKTHEDNDSTSNKIQKLQAYIKKGAEIMVFSTDVADSIGMAELFSEVENRFGAINGVIHAAGVVDKSGVIQRRTKEMTDRDMASKVTGTIILEKLLKNKPLDFLLLFSSIGNMLYGGKFGQVGYNAANEFLDAYSYYAAQNGGPFTVTINWVDWKEVGMAVRTLKEKNLDIDKELTDAVVPSEGIEIFNRILGIRQPQVALSTIDMIERMKQINSLKPDELQIIDTPGRDTSSKTLNKRPQLSTKYITPRNEMERKIEEVWQYFLGIDKIGINDNFFDLGATSLTMIQVNARLNNKLGKEIPLVTLFNYPTINTLAEHLIEQEGGRTTKEKDKDRSDVIQKGRLNIQLRAQRTRR